MANERIKADMLADAKRYHNIFVKNEEGAKILEEWIMKYVFSGFTQEDATLSELAKAETRREFVSMIVSKLNTAERGE
jgi:hypothetical protein|tara:strand:- start:154 stop:387 length:234 start_codon:yes stop_codon:yes gene_type:complete